MGIEKVVAEALEKYPDPKRRVKAMALTLERNYNRWNNKKVAWKRSLHDVKVIFLNSSRIDVYGVPEYDPKDSKEEMIRKYINYTKEMDLDWTEDVPVEEVDEILISLFNHPEYPVSLYGILGLIRWGSPKAIQRIGNLNEKRLRFWTNLLEMGDLPVDPNPVSSNSESIHTFLKEHLAANSLFWTTLIDLSGEEDVDALKKFLGDNYQDHIAVKLLQQRQTALLTFPDVVCKNCICRGEKGRLMKGWDHVICPRCNKVDYLVHPVKEITGYIGDHPLNHQGEWFSLWNAKTKEARPGDLDHFYILEGEGIDYNWAVAAVNSKIQDHYPARMGQIKVHLNEKVRPHLNENALRILNSLGPIHNPSFSLTSD